MTVRTLLAVVLMAWFADGCGRTGLLPSEVGDANRTQTSTSTVTSTSTDRSDASATSQPITDAGCPAGFTACGIRCYDLSRSADHCGQCRNACAPGIACQSSKCQQHQCKGALTFKALSAISTLDLNAPDVPSYAPVLGDFDGDGTLDFVGEPEADAAMSLLLGNGDGTFRARAVAPPVSTNWSAAAADLNGDGRLDLATISKGEAAVTVRFGNGDPATVFGPATTYPTPSAPGALLLADLDDDGRVDMVTAEAQHLSLWWGAADGPLAAPVDLPVGLTDPVSANPMNAYILRAADWNQDGVQDLLFGAYTLRMLLGRGDGTFDQEIACGLALNFGEPTGIVADFDRDGKLDLAMNSLQGTRVYLGMNGCNYSTAVSIPYPPPYGDIDSLAVADLDGDGNLDVITAGTDSTPSDHRVAVSLGDGHGGFASALAFPVSLALPSGNLLVGDLNHDTKLDLILTREDGWQVLLNTCP